MIRALSVLCFLWSIVLPRPVLACQCETLFSTCNEVAESDLVFIGTVQSIDPISLNLWNLTSPVSVRLLLRSSVLAASAAVVGCRNPSLGPRSLVLFLSDGWVAFERKD